MLPRSQQLGVS